MATALLGPELDIHCGGVDNLFPHHEAEIAQSECFTGRKFVKYWLHCAHLLVDSQKMSKSAGNFYTLRDLIERGYSGREIRYALISVHYRLPLNFTLTGLDGARSALSRIDAWVQRLHERAQSASPGQIQPFPQLESFLNALDDDLNISGALACLFDWIRDTNRMMDLGELSEAQAARCLSDFSVINSILACEATQSEIPTEITQLLAERQKARTSKDWQLSDQLRDKILSLGWTLKDTKQGQQVSRNS
jgi:cysteinyl-tRNA synthetase